MNWPLSFRSFAYFFLSKTDPQTSMMQCVVWSDVVWCGMVRCHLIWYGIVFCGEVLSLCGAVCVTWFGVVWCGVM